MENSGFGRLRAAIYHGSRSRRVLWMVALGLLSLGAAVGYLISLRQPSGPWHLGVRVAALAGAAIADPDDERDDFPSANATDLDPISVQVAEAVRQQLQEPTITFRHFLNAIPRFARYVRPAQHASLRATIQARFPGREGELAYDYLLGFGAADPAAIARLRQACAEPNPPEFARYMLARVEYRLRHYADAAALFRLEGERAEAAESRFRAVQTLIKAKDYSRLRELQADARYQRYFTPYVALQVAIGERNWPEILRRSPRLQLQTFEPKIIAMALLVAAAWGFFFFHLGEAPGVKSPVTWLCGAGLLLGVLSTVPTVYAVILQDDILGFSPRGDPLRTVLYYVGGVGLREELCKLLLFVPLLPFLLRRGDEFEALIVASFVGLGFAVEENGGYFMMSEITSAPGRFLTANFSHAALTGLNGLALFRACTAGGRGINEFCTLVPLTVIAHGLYDAGLNLPSIDDTGTISMAVFVACSWFYFTRVNELRNNVRTTVSLTGAYVLAVSIVAAATLAFQMMNLGPAAGARIILTEMLGSAILVYMFLRLFNEPLTD